MAKKKRTRKGLEAENLLLRRFRTAAGTASVLNNLIRWGALFGIAYWCFRSIEVLAGKRTITDIAVVADVLGDSLTSQILAWLLAAVAIGYGLAQRSLKRKTIERFGPQREAYEKKIDPGRSSSRLTRKGTTPREEDA